MTRRASFWIGGQPGRGAAPATSTPWFYQTWDGDGSTLDFQLTYRPRLLSPQVVLDQSTQTEGVDYQVDYTNGIVQFFTAPGAGTLLAVRYEYVGLLPGPPAVPLTDPSVTDTFGTSDGAGDFSVTPSLDAGALCLVLVAGVKQWPGGVDDYVPLTISDSAGGLWTKVAEQILRWPTEPVSQSATLFSRGQTAGAISPTITVHGAPSVDMDVATVQFDHADLSMNTGSAQHLWRDTDTGTTEITTELAVAPSPTEGVIFIATTWPGGPFGDPASGPAGYTILLNRETLTGPFFQGVRTYIGYTITSPASQDQTVTYPDNTGRQLGMTACATAVMPTA